jgi:multidrug efflux pump subunit AcrA (membrane-fusion protein)
MTPTVGQRISRFFGTIISGVRGIPAALRHPRRRWRVIIPAILVVGLLAGGFYYYRTVYLPAQQSTQETLQTTVARRGSIVLSASGSGTLEAANQIDLGFKTNGKLLKLNVAVGDEVNEGQVLAELDNSTQQLEYDQAKQSLAGLTSPSAIASAQQSIAAATKDLQTAQQRLAYLISPPVYYWEQQISKAEQALKEAQAAADATPADQSAQDGLKKAQDDLAFAKSRLIGAQASYEKTYVPNNFTYFVVTQGSHKSQKYYQPPTDVDILDARAGVTIAEGALADAQNLYAALTGGTVPPDASGSGLQALSQAQVNVQNALDNLNATRLIAPFSGTVTAVDASVGDTVGSSAVMTIADLSKLYVQTYLDEADYAMFKVGNVANVTFDALPDKTLTGKVIQVNPALDTSSGSSVVSGLVALDPTKADLLIGMGGSVEVIAGQADNAVLIPLAALHEYAPGKYAVFVDRNGTLTPTFVEVGLQDLINAEIKSGLQPGEVVSTGLLGTRQQ